MQHRLVCVVLACVLLGGLSGPQSTHAHLSTRTVARPVSGKPVAFAEQLAASTSSRREVFGFALASSLADPNVGYPSWNFSALGTVAFFGLHINSTGGIIADDGWSVWSSATLATFMATAHAHGTKVVVTAVLQDFQPGTPTMCAALASSANAAKQIALQVVAKAVDGVNVDFEGLNGTCPNGQTSRDMLTSFVEQLRGALPPASYLSIDTYSSSATDPLGFFDIASLSRYVDSFFVMGYDLEYSNWRWSVPGCSGFCLGPTAPLNGYRYNDDSTVSQYLAVVPASKVILGVPYYGRKACVGGVAPNAYPIGPVTADTYLSASGEQTDPAVTPGSYSVHRDANDPSGAERWDAWFNPSMGCTRELYWDDATSLGIKYDLVNRTGLRGVGIWNLNYGGGAPELWSALLSHFAGCAAVVASTAPSSAAAVGTAVTVTATAQQCANPGALYEFWRQAPGTATWQLVQPYSTTASWSWNTAGNQPGTYRFSVWARDSASGGVYGNSLGRWDSYTAFTYTLVSTPCTAATATILPFASAAIGTAVTVSATSSGCPHPLYEFWLLPAGSSTWKLTQAYSTSATFAWSTAAAPAGAYRLSVWARDASSGGRQGNSLGSWDAYAAPSYQLAIPCSSVTVSSPAATSAAGAVVSIAAAASACPNPLFAFWMLAPGSSTWQLVQQYSVSRTLAWVTSGRAPGRYRFSVWAKDANSSGTAGDSLGRWDAYTNLDHSLVLPCSSVSLAISPAASARAGTTVTLAASATGCTSPEYAYWVLPPGSSTWRAVRGYAPGATAPWITGPTAGTYRIAVWARDSSSQGTSRDALGTWDAALLVSYQVT